MKNMTLRFLAFLTAGIIMLCAAGCEKKKKEYPDEADKVGNLKQEDMPYGATMIRVTTNFDSNFMTGIEYDDRFITYEEAKKVSDYITALNKIDTELMEKTVYPPYLEYLKSNTLSENTESYIKNMYDNIKTQFAEGNEFDLNYIVVDECYDETDDMNITGISELDKLLKSLGDKEINITSRKMIGVDIMFSMNGEGSYSMTRRQGNNSILYIYEIDGQLYIL